MSIEGRKDNRSFNIPNYSGAKILKDNILVATSSNMLLTGPQPPLSFTISNGGIPTASEGWYIGLQNLAGAGGSMRLNRTQSKTPFGADGGDYPNNLFANISFQPNANYCIKY